MTGQRVLIKGRCAIEALMVGCAVILCDERLGPMETFHPN